MPRFASVSPRARFLVALRGFAASGADVEHFAADGRLDPGGVPLQRQHARPLLWLASLHIFPCHAIRGLADGVGRGGPAVCCLAGAMPRLTLAPPQFLIFPPRGRQHPEPEPSSSTPPRPPPFRSRRLAAARAPGRHPHIRCMSGPRGRGGVGRLPGGDSDASWRVQPLPPLRPHRLPRAPVPGTSGASGASGAPWPSAVATSSLRSSLLQEPSPLGARPRVVPAAPRGRRGHRPGTSTSSPESRSEGRLGLGMARVTQRHHAVLVQLVGTASGHSQWPQRQHQRH